MSTIITRALGATGDPLRGAGLSNFVSDIDAVATIIFQRLQFLQGDWWENRNAGLPLFQTILGYATTSQAVALVLRKIILSVPYVTTVQNLKVNYVPAARAFSFNATVLTQFGTIPIPNQSLTLSG